jgi:hypothetical protein
MLIKLRNWRQNCEQINYNPEKTPYNNITGRNVRGIILIAIYKLLLSVNSEQKRLFAIITIIARSAIIWVAIV